MPDELIPKAEVQLHVPADALPPAIRDAAPVAVQSTSHANTAKLQSEKVVLAAPMSFAGSAARIWKLVGLSEQPAARVALAVAAISLICVAWMSVTVWYILFGLFLAPYRLIRRGQRKRKREALQHREMMAAIQGERRP